MKQKILSSMEIRRVTGLMLVSIAVVLFSLLAPHVRKVDVYGADEIPPCGSDNVCYVLQPIIFSERWGGEWVEVGARPADIEKFYSVAVCGDYILAGSDLGVHSRHISGSGDWVKEQAGITAAPTTVIFHPDDCTVAYSTSVGHGVYWGKYTDQMDWEWIRVDKDQQLAAARSVVILPSTSSNEKVMYVAGDFGIQWLSPLPTTAQAWQAAGITSQTASITADGDNPNFAVASVWNVGVYNRVADNVWSPLVTNQPADKLVYQATREGSRGLAGTQTGAFFWDNGIWTRIPSIQQTAFSVAASDLGWLAGVRVAGVMASTDDGKTWLPHNAGLEGVGTPDFQVRDLLPCPSGHGQCLFAATTTGIWRWGLYLSDPQGK